MKKLTYDTAYKELQEITKSLENEELKVEQLEENITRATELIQFCKERLRQVEQKLKETVKE